MGEKRQISLAKEFLVTYGDASPLTWGHKSQFCKCRLHMVISFQRVQCGKEWGESNFPRRNLINTSSDDYSQDLWW